MNVRPDVLRCVIIHHTFDPVDVDAPGSCVCADQPSGWHISSIHCSLRLRLQELYEFKEIPSRCFWDIVFTRMGRTDRLTDNPKTLCWSGGIKRKKFWNCAGAHCRYFELSRLVYRYTKKKITFLWLLCAACTQTHTHSWIFPCSNSFSVFFLSPGESREENSAAWIPPKSCTRT